MTSDNPQCVIPFGRIPRWVLIGPKHTPGPWASLKPADHAVLGVLAAHADREWRCYPSLTTIAKLAGVKRESVCVSINRLEMAGILTITRGGGRGRPSIYQLVAKGHPERTVSDPKTVIADRQERSAPTSETVSAHRLNGQRPLTLTDVNRGEHNNNKGKSDVVVACSSEVDTRLLSLGVMNPTRSQLANHPEMCQEVIDAARMLVGDVVPPGRLVNALRTALDAHRNAEVWATFKEETVMAECAREGRQYVEPAEEWAKKPYRA